MTRTVLILGASYAGLSIAHKLLKRTLPVIKDFKVALVNPSTHFYWNMASIRAIVPGQIKTDETLQSISEGFKYASKAFEFVQGSAQSIDMEKKLVMIKTADGELKQAYDFLVITTGSRTVGNVPWKAEGTYEQIQRGLDDTRQKVEKAKSIIIAGGGASGVELAGELGFEFGDTKDIKLLTTSDTVMEGQVSPRIAKGAEKELEKFHVKIIHKAKVNTATTASSGETEVALESGDKLIADLFLPTYGLMPNTEFLPKELLNSKGELILDEYLHVKNWKDVWAAGDVGDLQRNGYMITLAQADHLARNFDLVLKGKDPVPYKLPTRDMMAISLGRSRGTGEFAGWTIPSLAIWAAKGRTLGVERVNALVSGLGV